MLKLCQFYKLCHYVMTLTCQYLRVSGSILKCSLKLFQGVSSEKQSNEVDLDRKTGKPIFLKLSVFSPDIKTDIIFEIYGIENPRKTLFGQSLSSLSVSRKVKSPILIPIRYQHNQGLLTLAGECCANMHKWVLLA